MVMGCGKFLPVVSSLTANDRLTRSLTGGGKVGKIYACEIIPTHIRARVASLELLANWAMNFAVTISAPILLRSSPAGAYFLYGFSTVLAVIVCIYMPETKGRSLEDIEQEFEKRRTAVRGNTREGVLVA